jgi:putative membrane protein
MKGALAGFVATAPMSAFMWTARELLPPPEQYPLPPNQIVADVAAKTGMGEAAAGPDHVLATAAAHFGYGAAAGALYTALPHQLSPSPALNGALFGLLVWSGSYLGLLPALGILRPATEHPARRNALMIAAHVVWGATLGMMVDYLEQRQETNREFEEVEQWHV